MKEADQREGPTVAVTILRHQHHGLAICTPADELRSLKILRNPESVLGIDSINVHTFQ